jgi:biopolymer transport protein ExbD
MSAWLVRQEGSDQVYALPTQEAVLTALRDGNFVPTDEVKGPGDANWRPFESHPEFAEAALDLEPPPAEGKDDTHLDMNPLIDVCLVLLIFFILTITYATLERALDVPQDTPDEKGVKSTEWKDIKDRVFKVTVRMVPDASHPKGERPVIRIEGKEVPYDKEKIFKEMESVINTTGKREMLLDIDREVEWGVDTTIVDAAKGNKIHNIINNQRPR